MYKVGDIVRITMKGVRRNDIGRISGVWNNGEEYDVDIFYDNEYLTTMSFLPNELTLHVAGYTTWGKKKYGISE